MTKRQSKGQGPTGQIDPGKGKGKGKGKKVGHWERVPAHITFGGKRRLAAGL